jgi:ankyrin repeat protein
MNYIRRAIINNDVKILKDAIEKGLDVNTEIENRSLLALALLWSSIECVKLLLEFKAHLSTILRTNTFSHACVTGRIDLAQLMLEHKADIFTLDNGFYPLHRAVSSGSLDLTRYLLKTGASKMIDVKSSNEITPLYFAVSGRYSLSIVSILLDYGAKIDNMKEPNLHCDLFIKRKNIKCTLIVFYHLGRKTKWLKKDMTNIIGKMVWETRDHDEWLMNQNPSKKIQKINF